MTKKNAAIRALLSAFCLLLSSILLSGCYFGGAKYPLALDDIYLPDPRNSALIKVASELEYAPNEIALVVDDKITYPELTTQKLKLPCRPWPQGFELTVAYYLDDQRLVLANSTHYDDFYSMSVSPTKAALWFDDSYFEVRDFAAGSFIGFAASDGGGTSISPRKASPDGRLIAYIKTVGGSDSLYIADISSETPSEIMVMPFGGRELIGFDEGSGGFYYADVYDERGVRYAESVYRAPIDGSAPELVYQAAYQKENITYISSRYLFTSGNESFNLIDLKTGEVSQYSIGPFTEIFNASVSDDAKYACLVFNKIDVNGVAYLNMLTLNLQTGSTKTMFDSRLEHDVQLSSAAFFKGNLLLVAYYGEKAAQPYTSKLYQIIH